MTTRAPNDRRPHRGVGRAALGAGEIGCPNPGCGGTLMRWGYGRRGRVRSLGAQTLDVRPRWTRCTRCARTQILLPATVQPRLADTTEVIGTALASKAAGHGHRHIATELDRSPSTVRRWMRRATRDAHLEWLWQRGSQALIRLDPDAFNRLPRATNPLRDALTVLAAAACAGPRLLRRGSAALGPLNHPLDRFVGGTAQFRRAAIRPDLAIRRNDVSYAPLQTSIELPGRCCDSWRYHRHRPGPQLPEKTQRARKAVGTSTWPPVGTS